MSLLKKRYQILKSLGLRGSGQPFLAHDQQSSPTALCVLQQSGVKTPQAFESLSRVLKRVGRHPQIPNLIDAFEEAGQFYLVQEFVKGINLETWLTEQILLQPKQIRQLLVEILPVLHFIHQHQLIHGNLKPTSLIYRQDDAWVPLQQRIAPHPELMLVNFGTARLSYDLTPILADPAYAAPELLKGNACYASDLYSLGLTCAHLLTGIPPFNLIAAGLPGLDDQPLERILERLITLDLTVRFDSAEAVLQAMKQRGLLPRQANLNTQVLDPTWQCYATLTRQQTGLLGAVNTVAISPEGQLLATGNDDHTICLWHLDTGQQLNTLTGHTGAVKALAFAPAGHWLASASVDGSIKLWETHTWQAVQTLTGHERAVNAVAFHPNGQQLASGGADATVRLWDLQTGGVTGSWQGHRLAITAIAYRPSTNQCPNTNQLATASLDHTVKVWDVTTQCLLYTLTQHTRAVRAVAFNPHGTLLATAGDDHQILLWNLTTHQLDCPALEHSWAVTTLTFTPDGQTLISGSWDKTVKRWHSPNGQLMSVLKGHTDLINSVAVHPCKQIIASASKDRTVRLWH